jgi:glycosyltransferase involved in cell wall biosynthesis
LLGYRDDVPRLLESVDLMIHPTHADALPTALIHALSRGVPIVATDVGGIPEIVDEEVGMLVPAGDPARLATAIQGLTEDPARRAALGRAARKRFEEGFEARMWARRLGAIYRETTTGAEPRRRA